jgi:hypothetical protein
MLIKISRTTVLAIVLATPLLSLAAALNTKTGAWEMTTTTVRTGSMIPADVLAKMSPEQRAKMEAAMTARAGQNKTHVHQHCVTQADLDQSRMLESDDDAKCSRKIISSSSSKLVLERQCPAPHASKVHMTMESASSDRIVASIDVTQGTNGKVHMDIKGRWLGASCAGIKNGK